MFDDSEDTSNAKISGDTLSFDLGHNGPGMTGSYKKALVADCCQHICLPQGTTRSGF
jgi:hypothetical protein